MMKMKTLNFPFEIKADDISDSGYFSGYGSTFGGKPDSYGDVIVPGAFADTLSKGGGSGTSVKMLWQHDPTKPIGIWKSITENRKGLKVEGQLALDVQQGKEAHVLMKLGALDALSIGFGRLNEDDFYFDEKKGIRHLKKINLFEISPVTFPANINATITAVKSIIENAKTEREVEEYLRDVGHSNTSAKYLVSLMLPSLREVWKGEEKKIDFNSLLNDLYAWTNNNKNVRRNL